LLFALLRSDQRPFLLHLFGHPGEPDVQVAQTIATDQDVEQDFYCDPIPGQDESIRILREYIPQSSLVATASSMLKLRYYPKMYAENKMLIDGGMGEIGRRQFMNRLLLRGKRALRTKNARAIGRHMSVHRASIFSDEVNVIMKGGIEKQIQSIWDTMPEVNQIGEENFLDLLIVRYRFPNYGGMEQARMDGEILNYMPFAQPLFVRAAFETPLHMRRKSRLYRQLIDTHCPALKKYPLVKGVTTYPYALSAVSALIWTKLKSKCRHQFVDPTPVDFLTTILEFIRDTVHSVSVSSFPLYNHRALVSMVEEFYTGKKGLARDVDWWLAFEVWRQSLRA
jgi:hypothetical protein